MEQPTTYKKGKKKEKRKKTGKGKRENTLPAKAKYSWYIGTNPKTGDQVRKRNVNPVPPSKPVLNKKFERAYE